MKLLDGTQYRATTSGYVLTRGDRELYLTAKSVNQSQRAKKLIATVSFDRLYKASKTHSGIHYLPLT